MNSILALLHNCGAAMKAQQAEALKKELAKSAESAAPPGGGGA